MNSMWFPFCSLGGWKGMFLLHLQITLCMDPAIISAHSGLALLKEENLNWVSFPPPPCCISQEVNLECYSKSLYGRTVFPDTEKMKSPPASDFCPSQQAVHTGLRDLWTTSMRCAIFCEIQLCLEPFWGHSYQRYS